MRTCSWRCSTAFENFQTSQSAVFENLHFSFVAAEFSKTVSLTKALFKGIRLNPNMHTLPWPKYEKLSMSRSCSQDDFAYRWFQKIFKYVNSCKDIFKSEIAFSKFLEIFEKS